MNEVDKLFEGMEEGDKSIEETTKPVVTPAKEEDPENVDDSIKNRRHRRLEEKLQKEREANIILNERLKAKEEAIQHVTKDIKVDERLKRLFGDDEKGIEVSKHFTEILSEYGAKAREDAIKALQEEQRQAKELEAKEIASYESKIEEGLESIEDQYGVDLTSDTATKTRKDFLDFVTKISPKDEDGNPIELPDLVGAFEVYKDKNSQPKNTRQKEIASRSMKQTGQANVAKEQIDETERWLNQNGIRTKLK